MARSAPRTRFFLCGLPDIGVSVLETVRLRIQQAQQNPILKYIAENGRQFPYYSMDKRRDLRFTFLSLRFIFFLILFL